MYLINWSLIFKIIIFYYTYIFHTVEILLKATGNAPILKTKKWMVEKEKTVAAINEFLRKLLKLEPSDTLVCITFIYSF